MEDGVNQQKDLASALLTSIQLRGGWPEVKITIVHRGEVKIEHDLSLDSIEAFEAILEEAKKK